MKNKLLVITVLISVLGLTACGYRFANPPYPNRHLENGCYGNRCGAPQ